MRNHRTASWAVIAASIGYSAGAGAAGFAIIEQSVRGLGGAFAGGSALAEDASTVFFNPAGMTRLGSEAIGAGHLIIPSSKFSNGGTAFNTAFTGGASVPLPGGTTRDPGVGALVPNMYYVRQLSDRMSFGLGVNAPWGLKTDYSEGWVGRYHAISSSLKTININPSFALKLGGGFSVGAGVSAQYAEARLTNMIDKSGRCQGVAAAVGAAKGAAAGAAVAGACTAAGMTAATVGSGTNDGSADLEADDWGFGFNVGALYEPMPGTRLGLHYRSKVSQVLDGTATFNNTADLAGVLTATGVAPGAATTQAASASIGLPETLSVSGFHQVTDRVAVMADVTWTRWSRFENLVVRFKGGNPAQVTPEDWDNSMRYALGLSYAYSPALTLRGGVALDKTPIKNASLRTPRIPGDDRTWVAVGASYQYSRKMSFDLGYTHLFVGDVPISNAEVTTGHVLNGTFDADVDILSAELRYSFD